MRKRHYTLKIYDTPLVEFDAFVDSFGSVSAVVKNVAEDLLPVFPLSLVCNQSGAALVEWMRSRAVPKNRAFVVEILKQAGLEPGDTLGIMDVCKGLSVNDAYWLDDGLSQQTFQSINLYENELDEALSVVAYTGFTSSQHRRIGLSAEWTTGGTFAKAWRRIDGELVLYKAGSEGFANAGMEPYSEFFASQIAGAMGVDHVEYGLERWKGKLASTCPLLNDVDTALCPFFTVTGQSRFPENLAVASAISEAAFEECRTMIVFDALVRNTDRHAGNYGFLRDNATGRIVRFAPLFDHNHSLFSRDMESDFPFWSDRADDALPAMADQTFTALARMVMGEVQHEKLRRLVGFELENHPVYSVTESRLSALNSYLSERTVQLLGLPVVDEASLKRDLARVLERIAVPMPASKVASLPSVKVSRVGALD